MKTLSVYILFVLIFTCSYSQNNEGVYPDFIGQTLSSILNNSDWKTLVETKGHLNEDNLIDYAIVLESKDSILTKRCFDCKQFKQKRRIILVLVNQNDDLKVIIQNNHFIALADEGGMLPYLEPELSIENGLLNISYQYTRARQSYSFKFMNGSLFIERAEYAGVHSASGDFESNTFDFNKNEITTETGNISVDDSKIETIQINVKSKKLSEFGKMYDWEVAENKFL